MSGIYNAIELVDDIEHVCSEPDQVKMRCVGLKALLNTILGRNKLHRPTQPTQPTQPTHVETHVETETTTQWPHLETHVETETTTQWPQWEPTTQSFQWESTAQEVPHLDVEDQPGSSQWPEALEEIVFGQSQIEEVPPLETQDQPPYYQPMFDFLLAYMPLACYPIALQCYFFCR